MTETLDGRAVAIADLFDRGRLDVVVANQNGPLALLPNQVQPDRQWIQFELTGGASDQPAKGLSNRDAIGAEVILSWRNGAEGASQVLSRKLSLLEMAMHRRACCVSLRLGLQ